MEAKNKKNPHITVSVVIPNWNGAHLLRKNLPFVLQATKGCEIIVVDDGSTDESRTLLRDVFPQVKVLVKEKRQGFAAAVNTGVAAAGGDIVVLLNSDVQPQNNFLQSLLVHFYDPVVFAVGCLEKSHEKNGVVLRGRGEAAWRRGFFVHWRGEVNESNTAWVSGGSGAFRKAIWERLGGMDELFNPFYWEDIDLSYRALKSGFRIVFEPKSVVAHFHEEGKILREFTPQDIKKIVYRNQFIFIWKNLSDVSIFIEHIFWLPIRLIQALVGGDVAMIQGFLAACMLLPRITHSRSKKRKLWKKNDAQIFANS